MIDPVLYKAAVLKAVNDEQKLPGEMPDEMLDAIIRMMNDTDIDSLYELMRIVVRQTKDGIKRRIEDLL